MEQARWKLHLSVLALAMAAMTLALTPAVADPLAGTDEYPDVAFLARNDVPFDAQTAASMAAQLGAPMFITNPNVLSDAARDGIAELNPQVLIVAGGIFAMSDDVAQRAAAACEPDCAVDRRAGAGRDETAAELAAIAADYGFDRPVLQGDNQVVGDVHVGGTIHADAITVQDTGRVSGLNADLLDGVDATEFARNEDVPVIEMVPAAGTSSVQPPDPLPANRLTVSTLDVAFTSTATGRLHLSYQAVFDLDCGDSVSEWAWLVLDGTPIRDSATRLPPDSVGAVHHTLTGVTNEPVPAGDHTVTVHAGADACGGSSALTSGYATGTVLVLGG